MDELGPVFMQEMKCVTQSCGPMWGEPVHVAGQEGDTIIWKLDSSELCSHIDSSGLNQSDSQAMRDATGITARCLLPLSADRTDKTDFYIFKS